MPAATLAKLIQAAGTSFEALTSALELDPALLLRIAAGRQPLPPQIAPALASLLGVELGTLRASVPFWTNLVRSELLKALPADPLRGDLRTFVPVAQTQPSPTPLGAPVLPALTAELVLWQRADLVLPTATVQFWDDLSGHAHQGSQGSASNRPTRTPGYTPLNGQQVLSFDTTDTFAVSGSEAVGDWTYYLVINQTDIFSSVAVALGDANLKFALATDTGSLRVGYYDGAWQEIASQDRIPQILTWRLEQAVNLGKIYRNGILLGSGTYSTSRTPLAGAAGSFTGHAAQSVVGAEQILYKVAHDDLTMASVHAYLKHRYNLI